MPPLGSLNGPHTPGVLARSELCCLALHRLTDPMCQSCGHVAISRHGRLYATPSLCGVRLGDPQDLPRFHCYSFPACSRPYPGGPPSQSRYKRDGSNRLPPLGPESPQPRSHLCQLSLVGRHFRGGIFRLMLQPAGLPRPPDWLRRWVRPSKGRQSHCLLRTLSPPLFARGLATQDWGSG